MSLILNKQCAGTQLYNKFLNKKQSPKNDLTNNSNFQYSTKPVKSDLYSANLAFTSAAGVNAIRVLCDNKGKYICEAFEATKSRRDINKLLNNLGNLDDSMPEEAEELEKTKEEIKKLFKNREIIEIPVAKLKKPFNKLLSSQPDKVRSGSKLVKWLIDLDILPKIPDMDPIYENLLKNKETVNPLMEFIGYLADGNKLKKIPDDVVAFIKGKAQFGESEEVSMADSTLNKLHKANLVKKDPQDLMLENVSGNRLRILRKERILKNVSINNIEDVLTGLQSKDPNIALPAMVVLKDWVKKGSINNRISTSNIKDFLDLVRNDNAVSQRIGLTIIDSLANCRNSSLKQFFEKEANAVEPILDKFDPKIYKFDSEEDLPLIQRLAIKATHKLIQNDYVKIIPERHAEVLAKKLDPKYIKNPKRDIPKMGHTLKTVRKLVANYLEEDKPVNFIPQKNVQYILNLTHHPQNFIKKESLNITKNLLDKTNLIENIPDEDVKGLLENLNEEDSYILNHSMSIIRFMIQKGIKKPGDFIRQKHVNRILELTDNTSGYVVSSALETVNLLLKAEFKNMKNSIDYKTAGNLINKLNSNDSGVVSTTMRLLPTLERAGLIKGSIPTENSLFRKPLPDGINNVIIQDKKLKKILEKIDFKIEYKQYYALSTINILTKYKFIDENQIGTKYLKLIEEISESGNSKLNDPAMMILFNLEFAKKSRSNYSIY